MHIRQDGAFDAVALEEIGRRDRQHLVMHQPDHAQRRIVIVAIGDAQVDVLAHDIDRIVLDADIDGHLREAVEQFRQPGRQPQFGQRERHADDETRPHAALQHAPADRRYVAKRAGRLRIDGMAGIGQRDAVAIAHEKLLAEPAFEIADLLADRGRGDAEFGGGEREAAGARGDLESPHGVQRRELLHIASSSIFLCKPNNFPR